MIKPTINTSIIISSPPFGAIDGKEGVDLALVCAAFEHQVNLIFVDEGIFHLIEQQDESCFFDKLHDKQLKALEFYEIENIYAESESLNRFALNAGLLIDKTQLITSHQVNKLVTASRHTVTF